MSITSQFQEAINKNLSDQRASGSNGNHIHNMSDPPTIRDVWEDNFEEEFRVIMNLAEKYKMIGMVYIC